MTNEGRVCSGTPFTGNYGKAASSAATGHLPPRGKAYHNTKGGSRPCCIYSTPLRCCFCSAGPVRFWRSGLPSPPPCCRCRYSSGAVVVLYLCGVTGFLRVGAVAVLLALAAVWVVGLVQYRPAGVAAAWKRAVSVPGFTLIFRRCCVYLAAVLCTAADVYPSWESSRRGAWSPKMVVERGAFYVAEPGQT